MNRHQIVAVLLVAVLLVACSATVERNLEGQIFDVPQSNDIPDGDTPFFLPARDPTDGFSFTLNPEASLPEQNLIGVASKKRLCARAAGTDALVNSTVCARRPLRWRNRLLHKVSDGVLSTYESPTDVGPKPSWLASCSAMGGGSKPALCMANLPYGNLVLTIHFRRNQVGSLEKLYDQSVAKLRAWER